MVHSTMAEVLDQMLAKLWSGGNLGPADGMYKGELTNFAFT